MHRQYQLVTGCLHQMSSLFVCWIKNKNRNNQSAERWWLLLQELEFTNTQTQWTYCSRPAISRLRLTAEAPVKLMVSVDSVTFQFTTCIHRVFTMHCLCPLSSNRLPVTSSKPRMCQKWKYSCVGLYQNNSRFSCKIMSLILFIKRFTDITLDSSFSFGWATQGHSKSGPDPVLFIVPLEDETLH